MHFVGSTTINATLWPTIKIRSFNGKEMRWDHHLSFVWIGNTLSKTYKTCIFIIIPWVSAFPVKLSLHIHPLLRSLPISVSLSVCHHFRFYDFIKTQCYHQFSPNFQLKRWWNYCLQEFSYAPHNVSRSCECMNVHACVSVCFLSFSFSFSFYICVRSFAFASAQNEYS